MALYRFSPSDPMSGLLTLQRELDRVFENPFPSVNLGLSGRGVFPAVNIFRDREGYVVRFEVPGVSPENVTIEAQGKTLTVAGKREDRVPENASFHRRERGSGEFSRAIELPEDLDTTKAEANYKHGVLTIRVPKREEAKPRQISVKAA